MTKLELTIGDIKVSWESPSDSLRVDELVQAFSGLMVAHTYMPESIDKAMLEFAEDNLMG